MHSDPPSHRRRSLRLRHYDYRQSGAYFVTVVAENRACLLGEVVDCEVRLNDSGRMVTDTWEALPMRFPQVELDAFVIMPNHVHGILVIGDRAATRAAPTRMPALGNIVGAFKSLTTNLYIRGVRLSGWPAFRGRLWQRNFFEHVIRREEPLERIRGYIESNPAGWTSDPENPARPAATPCASPEGADRPGGTPRW